MYLLSVTKFLPEQTLVLEGHVIAGIVPVSACACACVCVGGVNPCFQGICDFSVFQFFSFKAGGASSPFSLAPTKTLDECW